MPQPYLMSSGVQLHHLPVIFGALAGQQLGGFRGILIHAQKGRRDLELLPRTPEEVL